MTPLRRFEIVWSDYTSTIVHARDYIDARDLAEGLAQRSGVRILRLQEVR